MKKFVSHSEEETKQFAQNLAKKISSGVLALIGQLGAGKTTFVQGFAKGLLIKEKVISPTFIFIRQHPIPNSNRNFYHIDLYRIETGDELNSLGLQEIIDNPANITLIEWAEKADNLLPKETIKIKLKINNPDEREITLSNHQLLS